MLSFLTKTYANTEANKEIFGGDSCVQNPGCGVISQVYAYVQTQQDVYIKWVQLFAYLLYLKKAKKGTTYIVRIKYYSEKMQRLIPGNLYVSL